MDEDPDLYLGIEDGAEAEVRERGSRFLGQALRAGDEGEAAERLAAIRRRYHDATHHCSALRLAPPGRPVERSDDDGEPSGTAGPPILDALRHEQLFGALVVVTRWFGGTKLGTGGLARAYAAAARAALEAAPRREIWRTTGFTLRCDYADLGAVEAALARAGRSVHGVERRFDPDPCFVLRLLASRADEVRAALIEATAGRARFGAEPS